MTLTNIDMIYKALLAGETIHPGQCAFSLRDVISQLRYEGFAITYARDEGYRMEIESTSMDELIDLRVASYYGELAEQAA